jgi:hypothetical protein
VVGIDRDVGIAEEDLQRLDAFAGIGQRLAQGVARDQVQALALFVTPAPEVLELRQGLFGAQREFLGVQGALEVPARMGLTCVRISPRNGDEMN